jgi:thiol-disulfide isomerase/thioredoxin
MTVTRRRTSILAVALLSLAAATVGAQELKLPGLDGGQLSESDLAQGTHVIVFWTSWAPRGRDVVDRVNGLVKKWGGKARVETVNFQEDEAVVRTFLEGKAKLDAKVYLDRNGELSKKHRVNSAPWLLILKDGRTSFSEKLPTDADPVIAQILG